MATGLCFLVGGKGWKRLAHRAQWSGPVKRRTGNELQETDGLADDEDLTLFQDDGGKVWAFSTHGLAYFDESRFAPGAAKCQAPEAALVPPATADHLWPLSSTGVLLRLLDWTFLVEEFSWPPAGTRHDGPMRLPADRTARGALAWIFRIGGGSGLFQGWSKSEGPLPLTRMDWAKVTFRICKLDPAGTLWASTEGGLSRHPAEARCRL